MGDNRSNNIQNMMSSIKTEFINNNSMNAIYERISMNQKDPLLQDINPKTFVNHDLSLNSQHNTSIINSQSLVEQTSVNQEYSLLPNLINDKCSYFHASTSDDRTLMGDIGHSFIIHRDKLLGHGSYGDVFLATDEYGKQVAVKCCPIDNKGIPNILETSIMGSTIHPYLNRALRIHASGKELYIIQDVAIMDLSQHTRRDKGNHKPNIEELRKWCYCLAHAVRALHVENIIHADIKSSNVLLYADGSIRLTDYTLATKKWSLGEKFKHNVCTCTHRPLECLMRKEWDESLDIWSLGCTFYEIAYGELLFPYQGALEADPKAKDREAKLRLRDRSINAIIDWSARGPNSPTSYEIIGITQLPIDYYHYTLCDDYDKPEMSCFNDLVCKMLTVDPAHRPNIDQIIDHPFFNGLTSPIYMTVHRPVNKIPLAEQARVSRYIQRYTNHNIIQSLALNIYCRCNDLNYISEQVRSAVCTWIASKLVIGEPPNISIPPNQILSTEREICHNLLFRLHSI